MKEKLKDITISFVVVIPKTYDEFKILFPIAFDKIEDNPEMWGLKRIFIDFRTIRKSLGLVGNRKRNFTKWMTTFLDEHRGDWNLYGGACKAYYEDESFSYNDKRWIFIGKRRVVVKK